MAITILAFQFTDLDFWNVCIVGLSYMLVLPSLGFSLLQSIWAFS